MAKCHVYATSDEKELSNKLKAVFGLVQKLSYRDMQDLAGLLSSDIHERLMVHHGIQISARVPKSVWNTIVAESLLKVSDSILSRPEPKPEKDQPTYRAR